MKKSRLVWVVRLVMLAVCLFTVFFAILFFRQEGNRRRSIVEYRVYQLFIALSAAWINGEDPPLSDLDGVQGFAVYSQTGQALYRLGSVPDELSGIDFVSADGRISEQRGRFVMIRRIGMTAPPAETMLGRYGRPPAGGMQGGMRSFTDRQTGMMSGHGGMPRRVPEMMMSRPFVYLDVDLTPLVREGRMVTLAAAVLLALFGIGGIILLRLLGLLEEYRKREMESAHLVQLGSAARTLAHEIKNPLGVITIQCATLRRLCPEDVRDGLAVIENETQRLATLADRVRDYLNAPAEPTHPVSAAWCAELIVSRYAGLVHSESTLKPEILIMIDPDRFLQLIDNLISNARDACAGMPAPEIRFSASSDRDMVMFAVSDNGEGVPAVIRERLFEPFATTKTQGTGIGLALARRIAEAAGGFLLWCDNPGGGSIFTLSLPVYKGTTS